MPTVAVLPFYRVGATPLALEIMRIYNAGSSVYASCYSDAGGTTPMGNSDLVPIQADGNGLFPVVFLPVLAAYDIKFYSVDLVERDTYQGIKPAGGSGGAGIDNYTVMVTGADTTPGYLGDKLLDSTTVTWHVVNAGGYEQLQARVNAASVLDGKVRVDAGDANPGYLQDKLVQGRMMSLTLDGQQIVVAFDGPDYVARTGGNYTGSVTFEDVIIAQAGCLFGNTLIEGMLNVNGTTTLNGPVYTGSTFVQGTLALPNIPGSGSWLAIDVAGNVTRTTLPNMDDHLVIASLGDTIPGPLGVKLQAGAGLQINTTVDGVNGEVMHISSIYVPATAPLHQVMTGDGAGGVLSSPDFTAIDGAVVSVSLVANGTGTAVSTPNGAMLAKGIALIDQSAWGGAGYAYYGIPGANPPTNDGTLSGLLVSQYSASLYAHHGGSASIGTDVSRLAVYSAQAAIDVPFSGPAFHSTDYTILTGASYTSVYHAIIAFAGTATAFAVPAGNSINTSIRLSNSSAVGVAITGVATPFTLAGGASRDLTWDTASVTPKWY